MAQLLNAQTIYQHLKTLEMDDAELDHFYSQYPASDQYDYLEGYFFNLAEHTDEKANAFNALKECLDALYEKNRVAEKPEIEQSQNMDAQEEFPTLQKTLQEQLETGDVTQDELDLAIRLLNKKFKAWKFNDLNDMLYHMALNRYTDDHPLTEGYLEYLYDNHEPETPNTDEEGTDGPSDPEDVYEAPDTDTPNGRARAFADEISGLWLANRTAKLLLEYDDQVHSDEEMDDVESSYDEDDDDDDEHELSDDTQDRAYISTKDLEIALLTAAQHYANNDVRNDTIADYAYDEENLDTIAAFYLMEEVAQDPSSPTAPSLPAAREKAQLNIDAAANISLVERNHQKQRLEMQAQLEKLNDELQAKDGLLHAATDAMNKQRRTIAEQTEFAVKQGITLEKTAQELETAKQVFATLQDNHFETLRSKDEELQSTKRLLREEKRQFPKWVAGTAAASLGTGVLLTLGTQKLIDDKPVALPADTLNQAKVMPYTPPAATKPAMDYREALKKPNSVSDSSFAEREKARAGQQSSTPAGAIPGVY